MGLSLRLTSAAERDLAEIFSYTEGQWGEQQARTYLRLLYKAFTLLTAAPGLGRRYYGAVGNARKHNVGSHVILYGVTTTELQVYRLLHKAMLDSAADWQDED